jgi:heptosyltransferase-2
MSLPALAAVRRRFPDAHIAVLAKPWVAGLYRREPLANEILALEVRPFGRGAYLGALRDRKSIAKAIREGEFDTALLLTNSFDSALIPWLAGIPKRIGYSRDLRAPLLTHAIRAPQQGEIPPHESYYYLELLRRAGWLEEMPAAPVIRLETRGIARAEGLQRFAKDGVSRPVIGVSPGAAYGSAKRWLPERFAEASVEIARATGAVVALHGAAAERALCDAIRKLIERQGVAATNYAGNTSLEEFMDRAAASILFLTNDSGAMHIASALGVPTVSIFGATNHLTTGPTGPLARVVRHDVECSPCLLRECPIDHRCMTGVTVRRVVETAFELLQKT